MFKIPNKFKATPDIDKLQEMLWYVVSVGVPKQLLVVESSLKKCGVPDYCLWCPTYPEYTRLRNQMTLIDRMLYPGYCFLGLRELTDVLNARGHLKGESDGKCSVLGETTAPISREELEQVLSVCSAYCSPDRPFSSIKVGDNVVIHSGPLSGIPATVKDMRKNGKITLLAFFLNREITVETTILDVVCEED